MHTDSGKSWKSNQMVGIFLILTNVQLFRPLSIIVYCWTQFSMDQPLCRQIQSNYAHCNMYTAVYKNVSLSFMQ